MEWLEVLILPSCHQDWLRTVTHTLNVPPLTTGDPTESFSNHAGLWNLCKHSGHESTCIVTSLAVNIYPDTSHSILIVGLYMYPLEGKLGTSKSVSGDATSVLGSLLACSAPYSLQPGRPHQYIVHYCLPVWYELGREVFTRDPRVFEESIVSLAYN